MAEYFRSLCKDSPPLTDTQLRKRFLQCPSIAVPEVEAGTEDSTQHTEGESDGESERKKAKKRKRTANKGDSQVGVVCITNMSVDLYN